jgi:hypothetical protein
MVTRTGLRADLQLDGRRGHGRGLAHAGLAVDSQRSALADGRKITPELVQQTIEVQLQHIRTVVGEARFNRGKFPLAAKLFGQMLTSHDLQEFLTLGAYQYI